MHSELSQAQPTIDRWLAGFGLSKSLHAHTAHVLGQLPSDVLRDIMGDQAGAQADAQAGHLAGDKTGHAAGNPSQPSGYESGVVFYDYDPGPGVVMQVPVKIPGRRGASRSIVLKRTLSNRHPSFVHWLIAHELAHAHLRNGGRWPGDDPEVAADSLAFEWGFPRPSRW